VKWLLSKGSDVGHIAWHTTDRTGRLVTPDSSR
jgi:hypothetical protein